MGLAGQTGASADTGSGTAGLTRMAGLGRSDVTRDAASRCGSGSLPGPGPVQCAGAQRDN
eukprot:1077157-Rhodomonas_salina.1